MNDYELKQEEKRARYESLATKARAESERVREAARSRSAQIPLGQPILTGHHSEKRHRRDLDKIDRDYRKSHDLADKAQHYERKAERVGTRGISADDPEAIEKLRKELEEAEKKQADMKAINALARKNKDTTSRAAAFINHGIPEQMARFLAESIELKADSRIFPAYQLTNNNAKIRRIKKRMDALETLAQRENIEIQTELYTYFEDTDENRILFEFDGKPSQEIRATLKAHGFKWSPSRCAWTRQITQSALYKAALLRKRLDLLDS